MQPCSVTTKVLSFMIRERMRLDEGIIQERNEGRDGRLQKYYYRQLKDGRREGLWTTLGNTKAYSRGKRMEEGYS